jgi:hypothetical protein
MPIKRRRSFSETNLERIFLRVTFAVSLVLLVAGALIVGMIGWEEKKAWNEATKAKTYDHPEVYVMDLGVVRFPPESTDQQIKEELDRSAPPAIQKAVTRGTILRSLRAANRDYADLTDSQLASKLLSSDPLKWSTVSDVEIGDGLQITLLPVVPPTLFRLVPGDHISHLYIASSPNQVSMLYTRGQAIKAAASSEGKAVLVLQALANFYDSPRVRPAPFSVPRALALVASGAVALPWGLFFFLRWVARGLFSTVVLDNAMRTGHVCPKCQSRAIVRVRRGGDALERLILKLRGKLPYRCFDCDHRFLDRPMSKQ